MQRDILLSIKQRLDSLSKSEEKIASYILEFPEKVVSMSVSELAENADSSPATVVRLCRSLGLEGYTELKLSLSSNMSEVVGELYTDIQPDESVQQIKRKLLLNTKHHLNETAELIDDTIIDQVAQRINEAPAIYVYGIGASHIIAHDIKQKFTRVGKNVVVTLDQHELTASLSIAEPNSVYIGVSNSGQKLEGKIMMQLANSLDLVTVSMTQNTENELVKQADYALRISIVNEAPIRTGATLSLLNQMYLVDVLFYRFFTKNYDANMAKISKTRQTIEELEALYLQ